MQPIAIDGNPTCGDLIPGSVEFKPDGTGVGTFDLPDPWDGSVTVTQNGSDANGLLYDFQFTGTTGVEGAVWKGADAGNFYDYRTQPGGGTQHDTGLHTPIKGDKYGGLSHISFCLVELIFPSTALSLDLAGPLTVYAGSSVTLDGTESNDGNADLTNAYVEFDGVTCLNGSNQQPDPGVNLAAGADLDVSCTFSAPLGTTVVTAIGHGTFNGKDVTWDPAVCTEDGQVVGDIRCDDDEIDTITIVGINPSTDLDLNLLGSSPATQTNTNPETYTINVDYGGSVDLSFTETNDGQEPDDTLTNVFIEFVNGAPECVDAAGGVTLNPGEAHTVDCSTLTNVTAHRTITAIGHGTDALGNDVTWCADPANPPANTRCDQQEIVIVNIVVNFGEGCTPGLWRQYDQIIGKGKNADYHWIRGLWAASPYSYNDDAGAVFGVAAWNGITLGELTQTGGGGLDALGRHASAALQNILHPEIDYFGYPSTQAGVDALIADVQAAVAAGDEAIEALHTMLADWNDQGDCELNRNS